MTPPGLDWISTDYVKGKFKIAMMTQDRALGLGFVCRLSLDSRDRSGKSSRREVVWSLRAFIHMT